MMAWSLVSTSPNMMSGLTAVTAQLTVDDLDPSNPLLTPSIYLSHVSAYAVLTGVTSLILALLGLGSIVGKVDKEILKGFKWGASVGIFLGALPNAMFKGGNKGVMNVKDVIPKAVVKVLENIGAKGAIKVRRAEASHAGEKDG